MKMSEIREKAKYAIWFALLAFILLIVFGGGMSGSSVTGVFQRWFNPDYVDTAVNVAKIDGEDLNKLAFMFEATGNAQSSSLDNIDAENQKNQVDNTINRFANSQIINDEIENMNLTTSNEELDHFLKEHPPIQYQQLMMAGGFFKTKTGNYNDKLAHIDCNNNDDVEDEIKGTICEIDITTLQPNPNWNSSMGNRTKDDGEEFFDLKKWKESYGSDWNTNEVLYSQMQQIETNYQQNVLPQEKLNYLYSKLGYISDNIIKENIALSNDKFSLNKLVISYNEIDDNKATVTDKEIQEYYDNNKEEKYAISESVSIEYALFKNLGTVLNLTNPEETNSKANSKQLTQANLFANTAKTLGFEEAKKTLMIDIEEKDGIEEPTDATVPYSGSNFTDEANELYKDDSDNIEYLVKRPALYGKVNIHEEFDRSKSGFTNYENDYTRAMVRFAFDNVENDKNNISQRFSTTAGHFIFQILGFNESGYKKLEDVKDDIKAILLLEKKKEIAKNTIQKALDKKETFEKIAESNNFVEAILFDDDDKPTTIFNAKYNFQNGNLSLISGLGSANITDMVSAQNEILGCLSVMKKGDISYIIESETEDKLFVVELLDRTVAENISDDFDRTAIFNDLSSTLFQSWLNYKRDGMNIINKVHKVF